MAETLTLQNMGEWTLRVRVPEGPGPHPVLLMVHGFTGDENSTGIFAGRMPKDALLIAPRAIHPSPLGGYSWYPNRRSGWPHVDEFRPAIDALLELLTPQNFPEADFSNLRTLGFSQGAALTYTLAMLHPEKVCALAGLAGFVPDGADALAAHRPLQGKPVFVAHGTQDETVPVQRARDGIAVLESAGAQVSYCEDNVGHKLSLTCFKSAQTFFDEHKCRTR